MEILKIVITLLLQISLIAVVAQNSTQSETDRDKITQLNLSNESDATIVPKLENSTIHSNDNNNLTSTNVKAEKPFNDTENQTLTTTTSTADMLIPPATVEAQIEKLDVTSKKPSRLTVIASQASEGCPSFENANSLTQTQLFKRLVHPCRYDRIQRPEPRDENGHILPVDVYARAYIYFLQNLEAHDLQFKIQALLQLRYVDPRLVFKEVAPNKTTPILGEDDLRKELWVPHIFFANERDSGILGTHEKDILTSISPDGTVIISTRLQATLYCYMDLRKFPFDQQQCKTVLESWMYNGSQVKLHWEPKSPITLGPDQHLTEYVLMKTFTNETMINADLSDLRHGAFAGNYSSLSFTVVLARQMGFYLMDYFLPSMMIVSISWVSFWLQADQTAPRVMLGTTTMLTFITLASAQGKTLPKVSYIKASEIWFMGCTGFIFGSLVEFAFVNTIWRRKKNVELKKVNTSNILKQTLTPRPMRRDMGGHSPNSLQKSHSWSNIKEQDQKSPLNGRQFKFDNSLTVHGSGSIPIITTESVDDFKTYTNGGMSHGNSAVSVTIDAPPTSRELSEKEKEQQKITWTTMTPQQISIWIDKRSRVFFPCAFFVFNIFYWTFVNI
ncbi:pH-sensitive chloride channel 2-like isoform X2 [Chironomus tepperi]|uniref:pH-sensitive chloride channel 2-like isoform X2 n=1 Tax=Chironomus tepperi TaxID=113505 RepID=UPI00391EF4AC